MNHFFVNENKEYRTGFQIYIRKTIKSAISGLATSGDFCVGRRNELQAIEWDTFLNSDAGTAYVETIETGAVVKNALTFRELAEFKMLRASGYFKEIGIV